MRPQVLNDSHFLGWAPPLEGVDELGRCSSSPVVQHLGRPANCDGALFPAGKLRANFATPEFAPQHPRPTLPRSTNRRAVSVAIGVLNRPQTQACRPRLRLEPHLCNTPECHITSGTASRRCAKLIGDPSYFLLEARRNVSLLSPAELAISVVSRAAAVIRPLGPPDEYSVL